MCFPIHPGSIREFPAGPRTVPWVLVEAHRSRIERSHSQSLERLAERGGLGYEELYCGLNDLSLEPLFKHQFTHQEAFDFVVAQVELLAKEKL